MGSSRSIKADCTDDSSVRSSENIGQPRKKSSIGKKNKTPAKKNKTPAKKDKTPAKKGAKTPAKKDIKTPAKKAAKKWMAKKSREMTYVDQANILQTKRRRN